MLVDFINKQTKGRCKMTDRLKGVYVTFDRDIRDDDAEYIINAIRMIKHVADVSAVKNDHNDHMNRMRIKSEIKKSLFELYDKI